MYKYVKRILDLLIALILGTILLIPMVIVGALIKADSKGPALFKQSRTGKGGKEFILYKFRSMSIDNDVRDFKHSDKHTRIGSIIRKASLDELPQIINILKGEMSFIGPRPWIPEYYESMNDEQRRRCDVLPGISGLAQIKGRNNITVIDKINYDLEYVNNFSFKQDLKILFLTIKTVFSKDGADAGKETIHSELEDLKEYNKKNKNYSHQ